MIVETLAHGKKVFERLSKNPWIATDTETESKPPWKDKRSGLTWGRMQITIWSVCYMGESYCFPTSNFSPKFPTPQQWFKLFLPIIENSRIEKVFSNAIYDLTVVDTSIDFFEWKNIWDAMIGGWMANTAYAKGLKARAALYGRFLQESQSSKKAKGVDWTNLGEVADYSEQDVVVSDEMRQMQKNGFIIRRKYIPHISPLGVPYLVRNPMPVIGKIVIERESLRSFDHNWINMIELPVLESTRRAMRVGYPMDLQYLRSIKEKMDADLEKLLREIYTAAGRKINLDSTVDLTWLFKKLKINNPHKTKTGKMARGKNIISKLLSQHPIMQAIANRKKIGTLVSFYFGALDKKGNLKEAGLEYFTNPQDGRIHPMVGTIGAITGRGSCQLPNLTQVPARADIYEIKKAFVAPGRETK